MDIENGETTWMIHPVAITKVMLQRSNDNHPQVVSARTPEEVFRRGAGMFREFALASPF